MTYVEIVARLRDGHYRFDNSRRTNERERRAIAHALEIDPDYDLRGRLVELVTDLERPYEPGFGGEGARAMARRIRREILKEPKPEDLPPVPEPPLTPSAQKTIDRLSAERRDKRRIR